MPLVPLVIAIVKPFPVQITAVRLLILAPGLTVTVRVNEAFAPQLTVAGVTRYTAVRAVLVVLASVPLMNVRFVPIAPAESPGLTVGKPHE